MKLLKTLLVLSLVFGISLNVFANDEQNASSKTQAASEKEKKEEYPKFVLKDIDVKKYEIKAVKWGLTFPSLKDKKAVAVLMFGEHCPPCLKEIPSLIELKNKYKKDFEILALQVQDGIDKKRLKEFVKEHGINYPVISGRDFMDFIYYFASKSGWRGSVPYILLFDKEGHIHFSNMGFTPEEALESAIKDTLGIKETPKENNTSAPKIKIDLKK